MLVFTDLLPDPLTVVLLVKPLIVRHAVFAVDESIEAVISLKCFLRVFEGNWDWMSACV